MKINHAALCLISMLAFVVSAEGAERPAYVPPSPIFPAFVMEQGIEEEKLTAKDLKEMEAGTIIVRPRPVPEKKDGTHVMSAAIINASMADVFFAIMDCKHQPEFMPHLAECKNTYDAGVTPATATEYDQYQKLKFGFGILGKTITYTIRMFAIRPFVSGWTLKKGDIDDSVGYWRLIPYKDGKQILVYDVYSNPGMAVPDWIQEILVKSDLPNTVKSIRERVEKKAAPK